MQTRFLTDRARAVVGQKVDSTPATLISATASEVIPFGALVVWNESDPFLCKIPTAKTNISKPLGIAVRQLHGQDYQPKNTVAAMRKGRIWVNAKKAEKPGDPVYVSIEDDGEVTFTGLKTNNTELKGAIFLEACESGKVPIEVNFIGGV